MDAAAALSLSVLSLREPIYSRTGIIFFPASFALGAFHLATTRHVEYFECRLPNLFKLEYARRRYKMDFVPAAQMYFQGKIFTFFHIQRESLSARLV